MQQHWTYAYFLGVSIKPVTDWAALRHLVDLFDSATMRGSLQRLM